MSYIFIAPTGITQVNAGSGTIEGNLVTVSFSSSGPPAGMTLWLKGTAGVVYGSSGGSWADQSSNGHNLTLTDASSNISAGTINGLAAPSWASTSPVSYFSSPLALSSFVANNALTIAIIFQSTGVASSAPSGMVPFQIVGDGASGYLGAGFVNVAGSAVADLSLYHSAYSNSAAYTVNHASPHFAIYTLSGTTMSVTIDGGTPTTTTIGGTIDLLTGLLQVGNGSGGFIGEIGEILVYNTSSSSLTASLTSYLSNKWQITTNANIALQLGSNAYFRSDLGITTISSAVSQWNDQSGNGYNVVQATSGNRPAYTAGTIPYLTFNGTTDILANTSFNAAQSPVEQFIVFEVTNAGGPLFIMDMGDLNNSTYTYAGNTIQYNQANGNSISTSPNTPVIIDSWYSGAADTDFIALNGGTPTTGTNAGSIAQGAPLLTIGGFETTNASFIGNIYEIIIFPYKLSATQRTAVLAYVQTRYGIIT